MHSRLQVLVEFQTTTGPLPVFVPCCCLDELESYRRRSPKYDGPPRSLVTLIIRTSGCDDRSAREHGDVPGRTGGCVGRHTADSGQQTAGADSGLFLLLSAVCHLLSEGAWCAACRRAEMMTISRRRDIDHPTARSRHS